MADNNEAATVEVVETKTEQQAVSPEVAQMMEISLNGGFIPEKKEEAAVVAEAGVTEAPVFQFQTFTEKFGWQNPEDAEKEIQELRTLKASPPVAEVKYENEVSEKLAKAWQAGKTEEVYQYLDDQRRLDKYLAAEVTEQTADDIIKLGLRISHKDLTDKEIDFKFNKTYGIPKEPVQGVTEDDDVFAERQQTWKEQVEDIKTSKIIDAKLVKPQLETAKTKLVLPNIESATVDEDYVQYKKGLDLVKQREAETEVAYKSFTPKALEQKLNFNDEANKIQFDFQYEPDTEGFAKVVDLLSDRDEYFKLYQNSDGTPNRQKFLEHTYFALNKDKIIMEAMKQAKNATMKQTLLADNEKNNGIGGKQLAQVQETSDLDKQMKASLKGYM